MNIAGQRLFVKNRIEAEHCEHRNVVVSIALSIYHIVCDVVGYVTYGVTGLLRVVASGCR